ncbi:hypothetical protein REMIM1_CH00763 [Rhizobium etli bv. mimosae str. Mim1]|nr:hypothetical protein REMIM1_CH00763 [Rhizobium etli bv. mimosae str. Mim1]
MPHNSVQLAPISAHHSIEPLFAERLLLSDKRDHYFSVIDQTFSPIFFFVDSLAAPSK